MYNIYKNKYNICVISPYIAPVALRLTCSLLQLSAAEMMISSWSKSTSESRFKQMAEEVCTFVVSHNCGKKDRKQLEAKIMKSNRQTATSHFMHRQQICLQIISLDVVMLQRQTANNLSATLNKSTVSLSFVNKQIPEHLAVLSLCSNLVSSVCYKLL